MIRLCHNLSTESYGLILLLISAFLFSGMGCFLKLASNAGMPSTQLVFLRAVFQGIFVVIGLCTSRLKSSEPKSLELSSSSDIQKMDLEGMGSKRITEQKHQKPKSKLLILVPFGSNRKEIQVVLTRGMLGGCGFVMYFYSISALPLGDAVTLFSLYPIHTLFLARIVLGEQIRCSHILATTVSVIGAILIAGPSFLSSSMDDKFKDGTYNSIGYITAFIGSFFGASVIILIRKAGTLGVHTLQLLFSWSVFGILCSLIFRYMFDPIEGVWHNPPSKEAWWYIFGMCSIGSMAHFLFNYAGRLGPAGLASIVRSSDILFAYLWEVFIFGVVPTWSTILGVMFVLSSLIVVAVEKWVDEKKRVDKLLPLMKGHNGIDVDHDIDNNHDPIKRETTQLLVDDTEHSRYS